MSLGDALDIVLSKYNEACVLAGEVPLRIKFLIPPDEGRLISLTLDGISFDQAMTLLAAVSGLDVKRYGVTYKFLELPQSSNVSGEKIVRVNSDIVTNLARFLGSTGATLQEVISSSGLLPDSDVAAKVDENGIVTITKGTASDREIISNMLSKLNVKTHILHKVSTRIVELPVGFDLGISNGSVLLDSELQLLMRKLAVAEGTELLTMPTIVMRPDQSGDVEIVKEVFFPKPGIQNPGNGDFNTLTVGKSMSALTSLLGFGHELVFKYEDSGIKETKDEGLTKQQLASANVSGYQIDNGTKVTISRKNDGGYIATLVTATLVDATGQPISESEFWRDTYRD